MTANTNDDWRCDKLLRNLDKARENKLFTDVQFGIGKGVSKVFDAHKVILACGSPVFEKMFFGELAEKKDRINIEEDDPQAFCMLLGYLYGKDVEIESFTCAWKYFVIGDKYLVPGIQNDVEKYISSTSMNEKELWEVIQNNIFSSPLLKEKVDVYLQENANKVLTAKESLNVTETFVENILQMDKLNISEYDLLKFVTSWRYHNYNENKFANFLLLYQHIRFSTLTSKEFCMFTDTFPNAISVENCFQIIKHILEKSTYKLPDWCSNNDVARNSSFQQVCTGFKFGELPREGGGLFGVSTTNRENTVVFGSFGTIGRNSGFTFG